MKNNISGIFDILYILGLEDFTHKLFFAEIFKNTGFSSEQFFLLFSTTVVLPKPNSVIRVLFIQPLSSSPIYYVV
jgi:hypothetical protein